ncbi:uncharacterized protein K452DRAFT_223580 [Aplosporella prunicola CBS 121167]|uniref:DNL-type domain-containing protein n=1 Tax=Aplosporella prunicola CBS 121167 TaxID=1176127 RepID=A0A6A6BNT5_9PEZI|nr:uncharacterized protein K452DRAFT_223580 [Aplosporella prunicola CBS 121167]KAF2144221.1 hypothetical protein K452DRAFT_223580 [Aplosporella prunicola CBS 121167]
MASARPLLRLSSALSSALAARTPARTVSRSVFQPAPVRRAVACYQRGFSTTTIARRDSSQSTPAQPTTAGSGEPTAPRDPPPSYELRFTCKRCQTTSAHRISKQGYHHGTVLVGCPGCRERHLISDHMKIFSDGSVTVEDLMARNGQHVKHGSLSEDGDLELWDDGTQTRRADAVKPVQREQQSQQSQQSQQQQEEEKPYGSTFKGE